ncbi:MAG: 16S rRNA (guanine(966)-N(2))-methyltransferase RsmD [Desulfobacterales bacterium]|jgi:16S rRNA (guanine966-N2)-methyltransferase|nr:16S rRNA (guanine(966)-N(2))-methyltransferase RsmD [Desulfobacteraceae bacterium]MBT4363231.1 16S rRNA (guanine(966)-N(2))-methyltransferase RsmD [Desulfobacteraceae bacterium]MBT7084819.1 16S rRNA (guanine(966)-N(2))-methyltransferase RsmD [Desulfobacterales bacterium]MBT7697143.1 16S rRNA (guanine(966)-N(2))-methyltransferase RsmD [Desulfobacterales bacterium]
MGLRIIGGSLRGKKILSVKGDVTRPTSDRLRESIFNIISFRIKEAVVLDLYAGTGAFGLESLSRGAGSVVFVDNYRDALDVIKKNISLCNMDNRSKVINCNIIKNLNCLSTKQTFFDMVIMDPPYNRETIKKTLYNLHDSHCLKPDAMVVVEHFPLETIYEGFDFFQITSQRKYGKKLVSFLSYMI